MKHNMPSTLTQLAEEHGVQRNTLKSQIAEKLIHMISTGLITKGDTLPSERSLSETYHVSRETIRGAIQILAENQLIETIRGTRTRVVKVPDDELLSRIFPDTASLETLKTLQHFDVVTVAEARKVVEIAILRSAAINITNDALDKLTSLMEHQEKILQDPVAFQISDSEFHKIIYDAGENALLAKMATDVYAYALEFRNVALQEELATERSLREHKSIFRALQNHDADAAERAIISHVDSIFRSTISMLEKARKF